MRTLRGPSPRACLLPLLLAGCGQLAAQVAERRFPSIETPPLQPGLALRQPGTTLPAGARASLAAHDVQPVFVVLPAKPVAELSRDAVVRDVIEPLLDAMRFEGGMRRLQLPPARGITQPAARLAALAEPLALEARGSDKAASARTRRLLAAFQGAAAPSAEVDAALQQSQGMSVAQFKADIERVRIHYPFQQVVGAVPIEHTLLLATRYEGFGIDSVRGSLIHHPWPTNRLPERDDDALRRGADALSRVEGIDEVDAPQGQPAPVLVLLPYGLVAEGDKKGWVALRYAWRMTLSARSQGHRVPFLTWLDADNGQILKLQPMLARAGTVPARGGVWRRDPVSGGVVLREFEVDAAGPRQPYLLQHQRFSARVDVGAIGFSADEVAIASDDGLSSASLANFDQDAITLPAAAWCRKAGNMKFQQVQFFALLHFNWTQALAQGVKLPFPDPPWSPRVQSASAGCDASSAMDFGACGGYTDPLCPDHADGGTDKETVFLNYAHDPTIVAHEVGHVAVASFATPEACGQASCVRPIGWSRLHDLADAWADHIENTNCVGGWVAKNMGGINASNQCTGSRGHHEGSGLPRLHELTLPFNPASPGDHFPEHRDSAVAAPSDYADGQIAAAALWQVREGLRSICRPCGHAQYFVGFTGALKTAGYLGADPGDSDLGIYTHLQVLEREMIQQWASAGLPSSPRGAGHTGRHTTAKVLSGFARAGLFPIPPQCIDGVVQTLDAHACPDGEDGGEAVIDIDDNDLGDDLADDGVLHPERDFLALGGPAPSFDVWTGPRYRFRGTAARPIAGAAPCDPSFEVELASDPAFPPGATQRSGIRSVNTDNDRADAPQCHARWTPDEQQWNTLQSAGAGTRLYYRVRTHNAAGTRTRLSTEPGAGLWTVPPPYAVITANGKSDL